MGMFDTLHCHVPLPFPPELADPFMRATLQVASYQTKDLSRGMGSYEIRADGTLWKWVRPPRDAEATFGEARWLPATTVLGHIWFYTNVGEESSGWFEVKATIVDGHLRGAIELVEYRPVDPAEEAKRRAEKAEWMRGLGQ